MATNDNQLPERPLTPTTLYSFGGITPPRSFTKATPDPRAEHILDSPTKKRHQSISQPGNAEDDISINAVNANLLSNTAVASEPSEPAVIQMDANVIYNDMTLKYMRIIGRYQVLLGRAIELPRLVIAGAQSSGKSSLLENLTGLPVPITTGIGTRFPIEIDLIEGPTYSVQASIIQDYDARRPSKSSANRNRKFSRTYDSPLTVSEFEKLLKDTSTYLGLPEPIFASGRTSSRGLIQPSKTISRDTLRIEMQGPTFKNLSLVDTPGLYTTGNAEQDIASAPEIEKLVLSLISEKRTIIIGVMEGIASTTQQAIFKYTKTVDAVGERTIGVLTKCDNLRLNQTDDVKTVLNRATNKELPLRHGWYVIKNRSSSEAVAGGSIADARKEEADLFSSPPWAPEFSGLSKSHMGIDALRHGLSAIYCSHIRKEFPLFNIQVHKLLAEKKEELHALGPARSTEAEQRRYLLDLVAAYQQPKLICLHDDRRHAKPEDPILIDRKLAVLKKVELRDALLSRGCAWEFQTSTMEIDLVSDSAANKLMVDGDGNKNIYTWINSRFQSSKACEVPGLVPYPLLERLFEEQTESWLSITKEFSHKVKVVLADAVKHCLGLVCTNSRILEALWELVEKRVEEEIAVLELECLKLIEQHRHGMQIVACEEYFVKEIREARTQRLISALARFEDMFADKEQLRYSSLPGLPKSLKNFVVTNAVPLMDVFTDERQIVYQIHDILKSYYNISLQLYAETVCKNILHSSIVEKSMNVFSKEWVDGLSEMEVDDLVGESAEDKEMRKGLSEIVSNYEKAIRETQQILREKA